MKITKNNNKIDNNEIKKIEDLKRKKKTRQQLYE